MNDSELKQLLAKMLPLPLTYYHATAALYHWDDKRAVLRPVLDSELLHLCGLIEAGLDVFESGNYINALGRRCADEYYGSEQTVGAVNPIFATWQQRTGELAKIKGITL